MGLVGIDLLVCAANWSRTAFRRKRPRRAHSSAGNTRTSACSPATWTKPCPASCTRAKAFKSPTLIIVGGVLNFASVLHGSPQPNGLKANFRPAEPALHHRSSCSASPLARAFQGSLREKARAACAFVLDGLAILVQSGVFLIALGACRAKPTTRLRGARCFGRTRPCRLRTAPVERVDRYRSPYDGVHHHANVACLNKPTFLASCPAGRQRGEAVSGTTSRAWGPSTTASRTDMSCAPPGLPVGPSDRMKLPRAWPTPASAGPTFEQQVSAPSSTPCRAAHAHRQNAPEITNGRILSPAAARPAKRIWVTPPARASLIRASSSAGSHAQTGLRFRRADRAWREGSVIPLLRRRVRCAGITTGEETGR